MHIIIRKLAYLKTPKFCITLHNDEGGSSSYGEHNSMKSAAGHLWFSLCRGRVVQPDTRVFIDTWHGFDEKGEPVTTREMSDVDAVLARIGTTRSAHASA